MRFSWTGLIVAPLLVPLIFAALFGALGGGPPVFEFLILFVPGCLVSYGTTIFLFLPCLFLLFLGRPPLTGIKVCLLGLVLGSAMFVPVTLLEWKASGPDSGPPTENFFTFAVRWGADPLTVIYPVAGLVTAGLYWWFGTWFVTRRRSRSIPAAQ